MSCTIGGSSDLEREQAQPTMCWPGRPLLEGKGFWALLSKSRKSGENDFTESSQVTPAAFDRLIANNRIPVAPFMQDASLMFKYGVHLCDATRTHTPKSCMLLEGALGCTYEVGTVRARRR